MGLLSLFFSIMMSAQVAASGAEAASVPTQTAEDHEPTFSWIPRQAPVPTWITAGTITGFIGQRALSGDGWRNLPPAFQLGAEVALGSRQWWVQPVLGYYHANATGDYRVDGSADLNLAFLGTYRENTARGRLSANVDELAAGVRHDGRWGPIRLVGAGGAGWVRVAMEDRPAVTPFRTFAKIDTRPRQDQAQTIAGWASLSLGMDIAQMRVGITARYSYAPVQIFGQELEAGGLQLGAHFGWEW
jgi:hypothetical protein